MKASKISLDPALAVILRAATRSSRSRKISAKSGCDRMFWLTVAMMSDHSQETACSLRRWVMVSSAKIVLWYFFIS